VCLIWLSMSNQVVRFIVIGIINTIFGYTCYSLFIYIGLDYKISALFATVCGVAFNYNTTGRYVFNAVSLSVASIWKFLFTYIIIYIINIALITMFRNIGFNDYIAGFFAIVPGSVVSFLLSKYFVFKEEYK